MNSDFQTPSSHVQDIETMRHTNYIKDLCFKAIVLETKDFCIPYFYKYRVLLTTKQHG